MIIGRIFVSNARIIYTLSTSTNLSPETPKNYISQPPACQKKIINIKLADNKKMSIQENFTIRRAFFLLEINLYTVRRQVCTAIMAYKTIVRTPP